MTAASLDPTPLLDAARHGRPWHTGSDCLACIRCATTTAVCVTREDIARTLGVTTKTISRWRAGTGGIPAAFTERYATRLGLVDYEIWPELLDDAIAQVTATCALTECAAEFIPARAGTIYCTPSCRRRAATIRGRAQARERYANDPEYRARKQATTKARRDAARRADAVTKRQWYRNHRDDALAKRRARYQANRDREKARQAEYRARTRTTERTAA